MQWSGKHQQSMDPPWKVMNPASFSATLIVLMFAGLCKGLQSQNSGYNLTVRASVSVQRGLCVHIPCSFTYDQKDRTNPEKLYGYWLQYKDGERHYFARRSYGWTNGILVATNDEKEAWFSAKTRFSLTGEPEEGNCSFSILDARSEDAGKYYFRIKNSALGYSYVTQKVQVHVTELEKPQMWASAAVLSGKKAVYTCLAPGPCIKIEPTFSWHTRLIRYETTQWSQQHSNGSWTYGSNCTFTPSLNDQDKWLTCQVHYPNIWKTVEKFIHVDVADPPKTVKISTNATDHEHLASCPKEANGDLDVAVAQEGESISLQCAAESRPNPTLSWRKRNEILNCTRQGKECVLLLSDVRPEDAGEYQCRAETPHGSANRTLQLCVLYGPRLSSNQSRSICWQEDHSFHCSCSLNSWPLPQIQWEVDGQTLSEDSNTGAPQVTSRAQENAVTSSLSWTTGNLDKSHDIICRGANHLGTYTMHFLFSPLPKGEWSHTNPAIAGLCGALVAVILCVLCLGLIKFYKQRKTKASSKAGGVEVLNSANGGHQRANDGSLIYSNIPPLGKKPPQSDQSKAARERLPTSSLRVPMASVPPDPDELYYATVEFSKLKAKEPTPPEESVEYTEVKQK
ncbi:sialic acid-binding Ig-like lectin 14 [Heteronotia binoei]|uniref:sialic acid-binding Ig-like lectin 14 n=1 Tax=Heteronotia binoei TaxID=13085 RepID=UPI0029311875|nr:sialic acid-binding Ig-like lectin 14 [Heteronotia binoei]